MMEIDDKLGVLGDSSPQQTHLCESGDAIEFSNIYLFSTTDATSTDPINHRNELLRTYSSPDIAATAFSQVSISFLSVHRGTLVRKPELVFSKADMQSAENFFHSSDHSETSATWRFRFMLATNPVNPASAFLLLHRNGGHLYPLKPRKVRQKDRKRLYPIVIAQRIFTHSLNSPATGFKSFIIKCVLNG